MNSLLIRADASAEIGTGHVMRMLALAEAWRRGGGAVTLLGHVPEALGRRALRLGLDLQPARAGPGTAEDANATIAAARSRAARVVVVDGYRFGPEFQSAIKASGLRLMVVDDTGENEAYHCDWILNVNLHASESLYARRVVSTALLLGPRYALIRGEILRAARLPRPPRSDAGRLLVSMGGADPPDATGAVLRALAEPLGLDLEVRALVGGANPRRAEYERLLDRTRVPVRLEFDVEDVTEAMHWSDVALAGAGGTVWELALLGVPCVAVSLADNQVPLAEGLAKHGAVQYAGDARSAPSAAPWLAAVSELLLAPQRRDALVRSAHALVDGAGADRVVSALREG